MKLEKPSPETHPEGTSVVIKTIDNMDIAGTIETYTSDALIIKTDKTTVRLHPHEIFVCSKQQSQ